MSEISLVGTLGPLLSEPATIADNDRSGALALRVCNVQIGDIQYGIGVRRRVIPSDAVTVIRPGMEHWEDVLTGPHQLYVVEAYSYVRGEYPGKPDSVGIVPFLTFRTTWDRDESYAEFAATHSILRGMCSGYGLYDSVLPVMIGARMYEMGELDDFRMYRTWKVAQRSLSEFIKSGW